jgi:thiamine kinase-like enzyme|tara:strand:+ start:3580 stop:4710 length:1131 start_codon:yes stop_codon:yes gene_type:complete
MASRGTNNFKIDNYLKDNVFLDQSSSSLENDTFSKKYVLSLLASCDEFKNKFLNYLNISQTLKLIDSNYQYDLYSFTDQTKKYFLKVATYTDDNPLKNEYDKLIEIHGKISVIAPYPVLYKKLDDSNKTCILILSAENSFSFTDFCDTDFYHNIKTIANTFSILHEKTEKSVSQEKTKLLEKATNICDFENNLSFEDYDFLMVKKFYNDLMSFTQTLKSDLETGLNSLNENKVCICHCDMSRSRILYRNQFVKFINFQDSLYLDLYFDVALFILNIGLYDTDVADTFLEQYHTSHSSIDVDLSTFKTKVNNYCLVLYKFILLKNISLHIYEYIVFANTRPSKYIRFDKVYESIRCLVSNDYPDLLTTCDDLFICHT